MSCSINGQKNRLKNAQEIEIKCFQRVLVFSVDDVVQRFDVVEENDEAAVQAFSRHLRNASSGLLHAEHVVIVVVVLSRKEGMVQLTEQGSRGHAL